MAIGDDVRAFHESGEMGGAEIVGDEFEANGRRCFQRIESAFCGFNVGLEAGVDRYAHETEFGD